MTEPRDPSSSADADSPPPARGAGGPRRRALVTGASAGIGKAFAERLARDQYNLLLVARNQERLENLAKGLRESRGVEVEVHPADLTRREDLEALERIIDERTPELLVNNAGLGTVGRFAELDLEGEVREIELNVVALVRLTRVALPAMIERGHGGVINVSSLAGLGATPYTATYGATKAFVTSFSEALHEELRGTGVKVQALLPGFTRTEFQERAGVDASHIPAFAWMEAEPVVEASMEALGRGDVLCIPGAANRLLSGAQRLLPKGLVRRLVAGTMRSNVE